MPTLSQRLGSFPSEPRVEIFLHCRQDCPLPPPINRGGCDGMREEKIRSKISQKSSFSLVFFSFQPTFSLLSLSLSLSPAASSALEDPTKTFLLHQQTASQPHHEPKSSSAIGTATATLSLLLPASLSPLQLLLPPPTADSGHHHLSRRLLSHRPNHLITSEIPMPGNFLIHNIV